MGRLKTAFLLSYICIASISAAMITPALPQIAKVYGLTHGALGWVVSIFLLGYVVSQLVYGPLANRYGRLKALRIGLWINLLGILICVFATSISSYSLLLLGRLVTALGAGSGLSCTFMLVNEALSPLRAKQAMSYAVVSFTLGIGVAVFIGGFVAEYWHWSDCFWVLLAHGVLMLLGTTCLPETLKTPKSIDFRSMAYSLWSHLKHRTVLLFSLMAGFVSAFGYGFSAVAPIYTHIALHFSPAQYGAWNLLNSFCMMASGFLSAFLMKHYDEKKTLILGLVGIACAFISFVIMIHSGVLSAIWLFCTSAFFFLVSGLVYSAASYCASNATDDRASASSVMSFLNMGLATVGTCVIGYLPLSPFSSFMLVLVALFVVMVGGLLLWFRKYA